MNNAADDGSARKGGWPRRGTQPTPRHLLADPNRLPAVEVAFLNGVDRPTVEKTDADFDRLGVMFRGYIGFGVREQDPCATRLENVPFAWWRGEVQVASS